MEASQCCHTTCFGGAHEVVLAGLRTQGHLQQLAPVQLALLRAQTQLEQRILLRLMLTDGAASPADGVVACCFAEQTVAEAQGMESRMERLWLHEAGVVAMTGLPTPYQLVVALVVCSQGLLYHHKQHSNDCCGIHTCTATHRARVLSNHHCLLAHHLRRRPALKLALPFCSLSVLFHHRLHSLACS